MNIDMDIFSHIENSPLFGERTVEDLEECNVSTRSLSTGEVSRLVSCLESDIMGKASITERIAECFVALPDTTKDREQIPSFSDTNYLDFSKLTKILKGKLDYSFYDKLKSCFDLEEIFTPENIKKTEESDNPGLFIEDVDTSPEELIMSDECGDFRCVGGNMFTEAYCGTKFSSDGSPYPNPNAILKIGSSKHIKNTSDHTILLPKGGALRPYHMMEVNSICAMTQETANQLMKDDPKFLEHVKRGDIEGCTKKEVDLLDRHLKWKQFLTNPDGDIIDSSQIYETLISLLRGARLYDVYSKILKEKFEGVDPEEVPVTDRIWLASSIFSNGGIEFPEEPRSSLPSGQGRPPRIIKRKEGEGDCLEELAILSL